jgi:hypothetical protein
VETDNAVIANGHSHGFKGTAAVTFRSQGMWLTSTKLTYRHVLVKFNFELERFIGAILGPSSENGWFF